MKISDTEQLRMFSARCPENANNPVNILRCRGCKRFVRQTAEGIICTIKSS